MVFFPMRWAALAPLALAAACADTPVSPTLTPPQSVIATTKVPHLGETPMSCTVLRKSPIGTTWTKRSRTIYYPRGEVAAGNRTVPYTLRGTLASGEVVFAAFCTVPYTAAALRRADRQFQVTHGGGADQFAEREGQITTQGCVSEGLCVLEPIVVVAPPPGGDSDDEEVPISDGTGGGGGGDGGGGGGGSGGDSTCAESDTQLIPDNPDCEEEDSRNCPSLIAGRVIVALIPVAGRSHEFQFEATITQPLVRVSKARSPATYEISKPTASEDLWWIAQAGTIKVNCNGAYSPSVFGARVWLGSLAYANDSDLHMVMGPGHPTF